MNGVFIVALSTFCGLLIGLALGGRDRERERYYRDLVSVCALLINNISFKADKLSEALAACEVESRTLKKNLSEYGTFLGGGNLQLSRGYLSVAEAASVESFFRELGRYDGETQLKELRRRESEFGAKLAEIKAKNDRYGNMYLKLGALFGLLVGILLI